MYTYEEVLDHINTAHRFGNAPGVEVMREWWKQLGYPGRDIPFLHVAGTNGKGSVCAFLTQMLMDQGERVGVFTSPHLIHFEERITVNGQMISQEAVQRIGDQLIRESTLQRSNEQQAEGHQAADTGADGFVPTMFDYCLAMAMIYFAEQQCTILVIETGLGGRLDSTNALGVPLASVITKIGYDHTAILGDTLQQIASEKAGIMKPGSLVVTETQEPEAMEILQRYFDAVMQQEHEETKAGSLRTIGSEKNTQDSAAYRMLHVVSQEEIAEMSRLPMRLLGTHQWENAATARLTMKLLGALRYKGWNPDKWNDSISRTTWMGRMQILSEQPFLMVDGAHNSHGVHALAESLKTLYPGEKFHMVMAVMADKDYIQMIEELLPLAADFTTFAPETARALQSHALAESICKLQSTTDEDQSFDVYEAKSLQEICTSIRSRAASNANAGMRTVAFGSLYFIGDLIQAWKERDQTRV